MRVLSTFNGMGCLWIAMEKLGIITSASFSSEIDKYATQISDKNYPGVVQLGDVTGITDKQTGPIDFLAGGTPCQNLSMAVINNIKHNQGLKGDKSKLFYEFLRLKEELQPTYFLLENVGGMTKENRDMISYALGVEPVRINSNRFTAQDRDRLYWTNIEIPELPEDAGIVLRDIVEPAKDVPAKYWYDVPFTYNGDDTKVQATLHINGHDILKRVYNLNGKCGTLTKVSGGSQQKKVFQDGRCRKLMPVEYERLQNVPDGYTAGVSDGQRYNMLGNGWTVDVIAHILSGMLGY
jgi:site-specific DNA-cytosine methylase